jgi:hypothetical protein
MSNVTLYVPDEVKQKMDAHSEIKWSEVVRKAVLEKLKQLKKLELLRKYVEKEPFTDNDLRWMDENDWHPVDEQQMKLGFVQDTKQRSKGKFVKAEKAKDIFE